MSNGFDLKQLLLYAGLGILMTYFAIKSYSGPGYLLILPFILIGIDKGLKAITFDFDKKIIMGLIDNKLIEMSQVTYEYHNDKNSQQIKVSDKNSSFTLDKINFHSDNWTRLTENLKEIVK